MKKATQNASKPSKNYPLNDIKSTPMKPAHQKQLSHQKTHNDTSQVTNFYGQRSNDALGSCLKTLADSLSLFLFFSFPGTGCFSVDD